MENVIFQMTKNIHWLQNCLYCHSYLYISVFHRLQGLKRGGSTQTFQPLRNVEDVQTPGPEEDRPESETERWREQMNVTEMKDLQLHTVVALDIH